jgi:hypothetical protein
VRHDSGNSEPRYRGGDDDDDVHDLVLSIVIMDLHDARMHDIDHIGRTRTKHDWQTHAAATNTTRRNKALLVTFSEKNNRILLSVAVYF